MTEAPTPPPHYGLPPMPPQASPRRTHRGSVIAAAVALVVGIGIGYGIGNSSSGNTGTHQAAQSHAPTISATTPNFPATYSAPAPVQHAKPIRVRAADFVIKLRIKSKQCFGSAGCNLTFQIDPKYNGLADLSKGSWDVTYVVRGGEDGPQINTFTIRNGRASFDSVEDISTSWSGAKLTAKATSVQTNG